MVNLEKIWRIRLKNVILQKFEVPISYYHNLLRKGKMREQIIEKLSHNLLINKFMAAPTPRWLVLGVDILIVALSCLITYTFNPDSNISWFGEWDTPFTRGTIVFAVYTSLMPLVHTYRYIVRLSMVEDMYRVVVLVLTASIFLTMISGAFFLFMGRPYFESWNVFVIGLLTFSMLMLVRLAIKYFYRQLSEVENKRKRVIALGSTVNSFAFTTQLNSEADGSFKVVALLTLSPDLNVKYINEIPVYPYNPETIRDIFRRYNCKRLIFPSIQLKFIRSGVADVFLKNNIKLLMYSGVEEFDRAAGKASANVRDIHIEDLLGRDVIKTDISEVENVLRDQVVMVTGAAGSIGSEIVNQVASMRAGEIVLLDQAETPMHELQLMMEQKHPDIKIHLFIADVANRDRLEQAFKRYRPRYVFHAAAYKHVPMMERNPSEAIMTNVFGTKNLADLAVEYNVEKFVMISTDKAVNPTNVMGASKRIAEIYVQSLFFNLSRRQRDSHSTRFITTRFGNVLGSNGSVIPLFRRQIEQGGPVTVTHRDIIRYFMTIPEACSLVLQAGTMGNGGEIFIFDMGQPVKIYDLATRMISLSGLRPGEDIEIIETGLRPGEKLYEELLNDKEKTMATRHNKIMIAKVRVYDYKDVSAHLERLHKCTDLGEYHDIVAEMKRIVPEFKSKNSIWESIDNEIKRDEVITEISI